MNTQRMERVPQEVNPEGSVGWVGDADINVHFEDKLRSLSEGELQMLEEVSEESVAEILGALLLGEELLMIRCIVMLLEIRKKKVKSIWARHLWRLTVKHIIRHVVWSFWVSLRLNAPLELHV